MKRSFITSAVLAFAFAFAQPAFALHASRTKKNAKLFGYTKSTNQAENDPDIQELFKMAAKDKASKLVVFGGVHGYDGSGEPTGQDSKEKKACSFSMGDRQNKSVGSGVNFTYVNVAKYTTNGSDVTAEKQKEIVKSISEYLKGGYYVLVAWCYSSVWLQASGL